MSISPSNNFNGTSTIKQPKICGASKGGEFVFSFPEEDLSVYQTRKTLAHQESETIAEQQINQEDNTDSNCPPEVSIGYHDAIANTEDPATDTLSPQYALSNPTTAAGGLVTIAGANSMSLSKRNRCFAENPASIYEEELARSVAMREQIEQQKLRQEAEERARIQREQEEEEENRRTAESTDAVMKLVLRVNDAPRAAYKLPKDAKSDISPTGRLYRQNVMGIAEQNPQFYESLRISDIKQPGSLSTIYKNRKFE